MVPKPSSNSAQLSGFLGAASLVLSALVAYPALAVLPLVFASAVMALTKFAHWLIPLARTTENLPTVEPAKSVALLLIDAAAFAPAALLMPIFITTAAVAVKTRWQYPVSTPGMLSFELGRQWLRSIGLSIMTMVYALPLALVLGAGVWGAAHFEGRLQFGNAIDFSLVVAAATSIALTVLLLALRLVTTPFIAIANNLPIGQSFASASFVVTRRLTGLVLTLLIAGALIFSGQNALTHIKMHPAVMFPAQLALFSYGLWFCAAMTQALCLQALDELSLKSMNLLRANRHIEEPKPSIQRAPTESARIARPLAVGASDFTDELPENFLREVGE